MKETLQDFEGPRGKQAIWFGSGSFFGLGRSIWERVPIVISEEGAKVRGTFKGSPAAPGVIEGPTTVITGYKELQRITPGTILVCPHMSPELTVVFPEIKAIVTDHGGMLASAATIAREYGIPAVVGTLVATEFINGGDIIRVNGTEGRVEIVSRSH